MRKLISKLHDRRVKVYSRLFGRALKCSDILLHLHRLEENLTAEETLLIHRRVLIGQIIDDLKSL